jgi:hypothetical protein
MCQVFKKGEQLQCHKFNEMTLLNVAQNIYKILFSKGRMYILQTSTISAMWISSKQKYH